MSALTAFMEAHPWWTLVYLCVIAGGFSVRITRDKS